MFTAGAGMCFVGWSNVRIALLYENHLNLCLINFMCLETQAYSTLKQGKRLGIYKI
jgi:hypothetical protein